MTSLPPSQPATSPKWSPTAKTVIGLSMMAVLAFLLVQFRFIVGPLLMAFVLAYLLYPLTSYISGMLHLPWRTSTTIVFLLLVVLLGGMITLIGFAVVSQVQSVYDLVQSFITTGLPDFVDKLSEQKFRFGLFILDFGQLDLQNMVNQLIPNLEAPLTQIGLLIGNLAGITITSIGLTALSLIVSFFLLAGANTVTGTLIPIEIPGYTSDFRRLGVELRKIWNTFLRGQLLLILLVILAYSILLMAFGVRYSLALAVLAGLARFIPYLGPLIAWAITFSVAFFQGSNYFGLEQWFYASLVVVVCILVDQLFDYFISPRLLGNTLGVHPAALLITAIIAFNLLGLIGLVLTAPVLATLQLFGRYIVRKMVDLDPFPTPPEKTRPMDARVRILRRAWRNLTKRP